MDILGPDGPVRVWCSERSWIRALHEGPAGGPSVNEPPSLRTLRTLRLHGESRSPASATSACSSFASPRSSGTRQGKAGQPPKSRALFGGPQPRGPGPEVASNPWALAKAGIDLGEI